jgi:hypothetical protein
MIFFIKAILELMKCGWTVSVSGEQKQQGRLSIRMLFEKGCLHY